MSLDQRKLRKEISEKGVPELWAVSPQKFATDSDEDKKVHCVDQRIKNKSKSKKRKRDSSSVRKHKKSKKKKKKAEESTDSSSDDSNEVWVEKNTAKNEFQNEEEVDEENFIGPAVPSQYSKLNKKELGKALLPGEGESMASYVADLKRIPRRGEIGLSSDEIKSYEQDGYVLSGSRHRRMEAVRLRKEAQVYSAAEKKLLFDYSKEERQKKEVKIMAYFKDLVSKQLK